MSQFHRKTIEAQGSLGRLFALARERVGVTLAQAAKGVGIQEKYLQALEEDELDELPSDIYARHYAQRYAAYLGVSAVETVARLGALLTAKSRAVKMVARVPHLSASDFVIWPVRVRRAVVAAAVIAALYLAGVRVARLFLPPSLVLAHPTAQTLTAHDEITVSGKTEAGARVRVNDRAVEPDGGGYFTSSVRLTPGVNAITVSAQRRFGKKSVVELKVVLATHVAQSQQANP